MNFLLENLEQHVSEASLVAAELLLDAGLVQQPVEIERHLWFSIVDKHEVEVRISPSKVIEGTCDCEQFQAEKDCPHFTALLLKLRQLQAAKRKVAQQNRRTRQGGKKLTTGVLLKHIPPNDLMAFVKEYAKTNRNFSIALKARFAAVVPHMDSKDKYVQLLESAISAARKPDRSISQRGAQKILRVLNELTQQLEENLALEHYREGFIVIQSIIEKITPILSKITGPSDNMHDLVVTAFDYLQTISQQATIEDLRADIWDYCLEECSKRTYRNNNMDQYFFQLLLEMANDQDSRNKLQERIHGLIPKYEQEGFPSSRLLLFIIQILEKGGQMKALQHLIEEHLAQEEILLYAVQQSIRTNNLKKAKQLIYFGLDLKLSRPAEQALTDELLAIARIEKDHPLIAELAEQKFISTLNMDYYLEAKNNYPGLWEEKANAILKKVESLPFNKPQRFAIGSILEAEQHFEDLLQFLKASKSLELLQQFDASLLADHKSSVHFLYEDLLKQYLEEHLGRKTSRKIRGIMDHLITIGANDLAEQLVNEFRTDYPERHSLMEELAYF